MAYSIKAYKADWSYEEGVSSLREGQQIFNVTWAMRPEYERMELLQDGKVFRDEKYTWEIERGPMDYLVLENINGEYKFVAKYAEIGPALQHCSRLVVSKIFPFQDFCDYQKVAKLAKDKWSVIVEKDDVTVAFFGCTE